MCLRHRVSRVRYTTSTRFTLTKMYTFGGDVAGSDVEGGDVGGGDVAGGDVEGGLCWYLLWFLPSLCTSLQFIYTNLLVCNCICVCVYMCICVYAYTIFTPTLLIVVFPDDRALSMKMTSKDAYDALICRSLSAKEPLIIGLFRGK